MMSLKSYQKGKIGELCACIFLKLKGYSIIARRYKTPFGEIDIIAKKKKTLIAVEVKSRPNYEEAVFSVTKRQQMRIKRTLSCFLSRMLHNEFKEIRFDVIVIIPWQLPCHLQAAWMAE